MKGSDQIFEAECNNGTIRIKIGKKYCNLETCRKINYLMIIIFQIKDKMITHNEGVVVEEVVEDVGVIMTDMTITTDHTIITNMKEVAEVVEDAEETGGASGAGVVVTEATEAGVGIGVVVEAGVDTKMTTHNNNEVVGVEEVVEDVVVIMTVMTIMITAMAIMNLKHPLLCNTRYALICLVFLTVSSAIAVLEFYCCDSLFMYLVMNEGKTNLI